MFVGQFENLSNASSNLQKEELLMERLGDDHEISDTTEWIDLVDWGRTK